eukprot:Awhi_evm1s11690
MTNQRQSKSRKKKHDDIDNIVARKSRTSTSRTYFPNNSPPQDIPSSQSLPPQSRHRYHSASENNYKQPLSRSLGHLDNYNKHTYDQEFTPVAPANFMASSPPLNSTSTSYNRQQIADGCSLPHFGANSIVYSSSQHPECPTTSGSTVGTPMSGSPPIFFEQQTIEDYPSESSPQMSTFTTTGVQTPLKSDSEGKAILCDSNGERHEIWRCF